MVYSVVEFVKEEAVATVPTAWLKVLVGYCYIKKNVKNVRV